MNTEYGSQLKEDLALSIRIFYVQIVLLQPQHLNGSEPVRVSDYCSMWLGIAGWLKSCETACGICGLAQHNAPLHVQNGVI